MNNNGQLGDGTMTGPETCEGDPCSATPVTVEGLQGASEVMASGGLGCAALTGGSVQCWGGDGEGALGEGSGGFLSTTPMTLPEITNATRITYDGDDACVLLMSGSIECSGINGQGELGNGTDTGPDTCNGNPCSATWGVVPGITDATQLATGDNHTCAVLSTGSVECWGSNANAELAFDPDMGPEFCDDAAACSMVPVEIPGITDAVEVTAGLYGSCALLTTGSIECWGADSVGQLGDGGSESLSSTPVDVTGISDATQIAGGSTSTCARLATGAVECWGENSYGQLGNGTTSDSNVPVQVSGLTGSVQVDANGPNACAVLANGQVYCWGDNTWGQLGDGTTTGSSTAVAVKGLP
jgi:alpha-tubulin suppressor-like RCC1 family protein